MECPVCNKNFEGAVCSNCGYVKIVFPSVVPDALSEFERDRIKALKNISERNSREIEEAKRETRSVKAKLEDYNIDLETARKRMADISNHRNELEDEVANLKTKNRALENEKADLQSSLNNIMRRHEKETDQLKEDLRQARIKSENQPLSPIKGIVILEDVRHGIRTGFPVYEGNNTYGSNPSSEKHQQIKFIVRGYTFNGVHFSVRTSPKGLILEAAPGVEISHNGMRITTGVYARQADNFLLGDKVRLNISAI